MNEQGDRREAILLVLAFIIHWHREDGTGVFASHQGFLTQLARRWRGLTAMHVATYLGHSGGRPKRVYRDVSRQRAKALGEMLCDGLGRCAISIRTAQHSEARRYERLRNADIGAALQDPVEA